MPRTRYRDRMTAADKIRATFTSGAIVTWLVVFAMACLAIMEG